jgi:hypothetical protein
MKSTELSFLLSPVLIIEEPYHSNRSYFLLHVISLLQASKLVLLPGNHLVLKPSVSFCQHLLLAISFFTSMCSRVGVG